MRVGARRIAFSVPFVSSFSAQFNATLSHKPCQVLGRPLVVPRAPARLLMSLPTVKTLETASFPTTVSYAAEILSQMSEDVPLSDDLQPLVATLLSTPPGARGLFVAMLTESTPALPDGGTVEEKLLQIFLTTARHETGPNSEGGPPQPRYIRELAIKNVVMPTAMVITYGRIGDVEKRAGSLATKTRAMQLVKAWHRAERKDELEHSVLNVSKEMMNALEGRGGVYDSFLKKWGYDDEQKTSVLGALKTIIGEDLEISLGTITPLKTT